MKTSPVDYYSEFSKKRAFNLYVKRDDLIGGNHARKVDWLFEDARTRGARRVLTAAGVGSNYICTLAKHSPDYGLIIDAILVDQPNTYWVKQNLLRMHASKANIHYTGTFRRAIAKYFQLRAKFTEEDGVKPYTLRPGGSNRIGTLGYAMAGIELTRQIEAGECPKPDAIFIASTSCGSVSGLLAGLAFSGMDTQIYPVKAAEAYVTNSLHIKILSKMALAKLEETQGKRARGQLPPFTLLSGYLGDEYGAITAKSTAAVACAKKELNLSLDTTYTGKAFAAVLDWANSHPQSKILFWNTLSSIEQEYDLASVELPSTWPDGLRAYFQ